MAMNRAMLRVMVGPMARPAHTKQFARGYTASGSLLFDQIAQKSPDFVRTLDILEFEYRERLVGAD